MPRVRTQRLITENPLLVALLLALAAALLAAAGAALLTWGGVLITVAAVLACAGAVVALRSLRMAFVALVAVVLLLPFATLPVKIVLTFTFLDIALLGVLALWVLEAFRRSLEAEAFSLALPAGWTVAAFLVLCVFTFVAGLAHASLTSTVLRHFVELLLSVGFFFVVGSYAARRETLTRLVVTLILIGALAALIGVVLWVMPDATANRILSALSVLGYPGGDVIRYVEDNPDLPERAIGTMVDPNVFGGVLTLITALGLPQIFARRPVMPRWLAVAAVGLSGLCLLLTFSRSAMLGLAVAALMLAVVRYRRLLPLMAAAAVLLLVLPQTQFYILRFAEGLASPSTADLATQMRYGEYKDAFILIQRYPFFGVGFAGTPDIDLYLGVSSMYLLMAEEMGLVGLGGFLLVMGTLYAQAWRARGAFARDDALDGVWLGLHAALLAALVDGVLDHYFFNLDFHHAVTLLWLVAGLAAAATAIARRARSPA